MTFRLWAGCSYQL